MRNDHFFSNFDFFLNALNREYDGIAGKKKSLPELMSQIPYTGNHFDCLFYLVA